MRQVSLAILEYTAGHQSKRTAQKSESEGEKVKVIASVKPGGFAHRVLAAIEAGAQTSKAVGELVGIPGRSLSPYIRRLENQCGFVEKIGSVTYHGSNQEGYRWRITAEGRKALNAANADALVQ